MELEKSSDLDRLVAEQKKSLKFLYETKLGRILLKPLIQPPVSKLGGWFLSTGFSKVFIKSFVKKNHIDLSICQKQEFDCYNDFFTRELLPGARPIDMEPEAFISPCDGRLSVYPITEDGLFTVKHTVYDLKTLLKSEELAQTYLGGKLWMFRLCVDDYHRYIYVDDGEKTDNVVIPGVFHTVQPIANDHYPIYKENTREYCEMDSVHFGRILMMEVGALLVGKIENRHHAGVVFKGHEKGNFAFGGSTIILLTKEGAVKPLDKFVKNTEEGFETRVKMGERVGTV